MSLFRYYFLRNQSHSQPWVPTLLKMARVSKPYTYIYRKNVRDTCALCTFRACEISVRISVNFNALHS